jgi:hypothetical protein
MAKKTRKAPKRRSARFNPMDYVPMAVPARENPTKRPKLKTPKRAPAAEKAPKPKPKRRAAGYGGSRLAKLEQHVHKLSSNVKKVETDQHSSRKKINDIASKIRKSIGLPV